MRNKLTLNPERKRQQEQTCVEQLFTLHLGSTVIVAIEHGSNKPEIIHKIELQEFSVVGGAVNYKLLVDGLPSLGLNLQTLALPSGSCRMELTTPVQMFPNKLNEFNPVFKFYLEPGMKVRSAKYYNNNDKKSA